LDSTDRHNKYLDQHGADINRSITDDKKRQLEDLLYPQFDHRLDSWTDYQRVLSREEANWLRQRAFEHLAGDPSGMADSVRHRMMYVVGGYFPIGFIGWWEVPEKL
jgi:hypothetical protein